MGSRRVRIAVVIAALAVLGFAGNQIRLANRVLAEERSREQAFTDLGWEVTRTLADLRSAQQAYVADGQDREYWTARADTHLEAVLRSIDDLRQVADPGTLAELDEAVAAVADIRALDADARELIGSDQPLQASDEIFTRGLDLFTRATAQVQAARLSERAARADAMGAARSTQASMLWLVAVVFFLSMLALAPLNRSSEDPSAETDEYDAAEAAALSMLPPNRPPSDDEPDLSPADGGEAKDADADESPAADADAAGSPTAEPAVPDLGATAALCTDFSNLTDQKQIPALLARTATLMNASGLVVWVHDENTRALQPALEHGYPAGTLGRLGSIPRTGDNPTAAAFASRRIQVVASDESDAGALAAPLVAADRCIGVLSAELRDGWESSDAVQATASIVAAQLALLLPADTAAEPVPGTAAESRDEEAAEPPTASSSGSGR